MIVWILLPAYNEEKAFSLILPKISKTFEKKEQAYRIVVVEDGSTDESCQRLLEMKDDYPVDMVMLEQHSRVILTDSGGMQKEAYFFGVPCVTLRPETEWIETVNAGWNHLVGANCEEIVNAVRESIGSKPRLQLDIFGDGTASHKIVQCLAETA